MCAQLLVVVAAVGGVALGAVGIATANKVSPEPVFGAVNLVIDYGKLVSWLHFDIGTTSSQQAAAAVVTYFAARPHRSLTAFSHAGRATAATILPAGCWQDEWSARQRAGPKPHFLSDSAGQQQPNLEFIPGKCPEKRLVYAQLQCLVSGRGPHCERPGPEQLDQQSIRLEQDHR